MTRVTVIDDDDDLRSLLRMALKADGFTVVTFQNGDEFMLNFKTSPSDFYVIDVDLGGITGFEVCEQIKSDSRTKNSCVILISANPEVAEFAKNVNADDYMQKPFSQRELILRIRSWMKTRIS